MIAEVIHPSTGERYTMDIPNLRESDLAAMQQEYASQQRIDAFIGQLPVSAEVKALLSNIARFTVSVGKTLVAVGKRLVSFAMLLVNKYPNATLGLIMGALLGSLIVMVPWIGPAIGALLKPLLMAFGLTKGFLDDLRGDQPKLAGDIQAATQVFEPLAG